MKKLRHIRLFEAFAKVDQINIQEIMDNLPGGIVGRIMSPAVREILEELNRSGAPLEVEIDPASRGGIFRIRIKNSNNGYEVRFTKYIGGLSSSPAGFEASVSNGKKAEKLFFATHNSKWYNDNGMYVAQRAKDYRFDGAENFLPYSSGMQDGYEMPDGTRTDDYIKEFFANVTMDGISDAIYDLWASFGEAVYKKKSEKEKEGKNTYPRVAFQGIDVYKPENLKGKQPADISDANYALYKLITGHDFWEMLSSSSTEAEANQKLLDKLADTKVPLKERIMAVVKYTEPEEMDTYKQDRTGPWATSGTSKHRKAYDLGMLEDSPEDIKKAFDSISKDEWQKIASQLYGGDLQSVSVNTVELQESGKSKKEQPNLFNQNKLQVQIDYDHTVYYN